MMKKIIAVLSALVAVFLFATVVKAAGKPADKGFDEAGYNRQANIFNGTVMDWCMDKIGNQTYCDANYGYWGNDKLIMKWNDEWNRGNEEGWTDPNGYKAWLSNEYNGSFPGGSGEVWHYKIVWVGPCGSDGTPLGNGGYCIWGQFATIMDQGVSGGEHIWFTLGKPAGYGAY